MGTKVAVAVNVGVGTALVGLDVGARVGGTAVGEEGRGVTTAVPEGGVSATGVAVAVAAGTVALGSGVRLGVALMKITGVGSGSAAMQARTAKARRTPHKIRTAAITTLCRLLI